MNSPAALARRLDNGLEQLRQIDLPDLNQTARDQLLAMVALLAKWNRVYNLTAVRDAADMVDRHLLDSLVMRRWLPDETGPADAYDVVDVGTGAGLPVLPLAIARPDLRFLSVESNGKKTRFQQQVVLELGLSNVTVLQQRVENVSANGRLILSRAFTAPEAFLVIAAALCTAGGHVAIMLGHAERLPEKLPPGFELVELVDVQISGTESARHVALCRRQGG